MDTRTRWWVMFVVLLVLLVCFAFGLRGEVVGLASLNPSPSSTSTTNQPSIEPLPPATTPSPTAPGTYTTPEQPPVSEPVAPPSTTVITPLPGPSNSRPGTPLIIPPSDDAVSFQMTPGHTGYSPDKVGPRRRKLWTMVMGGQTPPLIVDGNIYVEAQDLLSINASTGSVNWQVSIGDSAGLAYANGDLFSVSKGGVMSAYSAANGEPLWSTQLPGQTQFFAPTAAGGMVYAGAGGVGGTVYGVEASNGHLVWTGTLENGASSILAISPNGIFVSSGCGHTNDFDPRTGDPLWHDSGNCEGGVGSTSVIDGDYLLVQDATTGDVVLNASNGSVVRSFVSQPLPATNGGEMFVVNNGIMQAEGVASGLLQWSFQGDGQLATNPIVVNDTVYEGSGSGELYAVSVSTGTEEWSTNLAPALPENIVEGDDFLVVLTSNGLTVFAPE